MKNNTTITTRLEYLRTELRAEGISYAETIELQSLQPYIDKYDVELREAAGLPEFEEEDEDEENIDITLKYTEEEPTDLFETPELIPDNVRAVLDSYLEPTYETLGLMLDECEELGYTFDYYIDAMPYDLRKIETNQ
jgi:hypothetical protein